MRSAEEVCAQHAYNKLGRHDLAYYEKRIAELKDPYDRWRMRLSLQELKWIFGSYTTDPYVVKDDSNVVEEPDK